MITFDRPAIEKEIAELEGRMAAPGFWEKREQATEVSRRLERNRSLLSRYDELEEELEDIDVLYQMALEMDDEEELSKVVSRVSALEQRLRAFRIELTFSGPYDLADCYLSINAGAGGTDS